VLGTLPFLYDVWLDGEDALAISGWSAASSAGESDRLADAIDQHLDTAALAAIAGVDL
jgi:hypothetical protein